MTEVELLAFLRRCRLGVVSTVAADGRPQAAVVGVAFTDACEIVFDTLADTHKAKNLRADPRCAITLWDGEITAQLEGVADFPDGDELARIRAAYFAVYPDGRERLAWPGLQHVRVRPHACRYSDFTRSPPTISELSL